MKLDTVLSKFSRVLAGAILALLLSANVAAHTALQDSTPGDSATIKTPPAHLDLVFNGPVRLVKLELMGVGHEMPTKFEPKTDAMATYRI